MCSRRYGISVTGGFELVLGKAIDDKSQLMSEATANTIVHLAARFLYYDMGTSFTLSPL
jgi:hypothetical protein